MHSKLTGQIHGQNIYRVQTTKTSPLSQELWIPWTGEQYIDMLSPTATWLKEPLVWCNIAIVFVILCQVQVLSMNQTRSKDPLWLEWSCDDDHTQHTNLIYQTQCTLHSIFLPEHKNPNIHLQPVSGHQSHPTAYMFQPHRTEHGGNAAMSNKAHSQSHV